MKIEEFISDLDKRTIVIRSKRPYPYYPYQHGPGLRSSQVIALAERVCDIISQVETLCERMEALERAADYPR